MRLRKQHFTVLISFLFIVSTLLPACQVGPPVVAADTGESRTSAQPEPVVPVTVPEPLPPRVVLVTPETGEEIPLDAPLQVVFDQPMDAAAVEAAFSIDPPVVGNFEWPLPHIMEFKPKTGFERATRYTVRLEESGLSQAGLPLQEALSYHFETVGFLEVTTVQPADGTAEVAAEAVVTVLFNRPVVPLTAIEDQDRLPQPITFVPPVRGKGEWLNTSIYMFTPDEGFEPATTYKARIGHSLTDTTGGVLAEDYTWEFTTVMPAVVATSPDEDDIYVSIQPTIQVAFNQPMDRKSAEAGFAMYCGKKAEEVEGAFEWSDEGLAQPEETGQRGYSYTWDEGEGPPSVGAETMSFTPHRPLDFGTTCLGVIAEGTQGAKGQTGTGEDYMWAFTTIEYPSILSTYPADGDDDADPWDNLQVTFSSPMDPGSINDNFTITPAITATEVHTYWWSSNTRLEISFDTKASSNYKVTLSRNIRGRDGQKLDKDTTIRWGTRAMDPMVYLYAPYRVGTYLAYTPTMAYVNVRNLNQVDFGLYHMPLEDFRRANGEDSWEYWGDYVGTRKNLVRSWSLPVAPELNESLVYGTNLAGEKGASLDPGIYYLEAEAPSDAVYPEAKGYDWLPLERQIIVVSKHNLTLKTTATDSLVWAADLKSGDVSPGLPVQLVNKSGDVLTKGKTDRDGVFVGDEHEPIDVWDSLFAFVGDPDEPDEDFAITISRWDDGISPWEFDMPVEDYLQPVTAYFFTDRTIYRPGQKVYFKGIIREDDDAHYALPGQHSEVEMAIYDGQGTRVFEESMSLSDMGTVDGEFELSEEAALGYYSIEAIYEEQYISAGFQVAEYRKPEFQVAVETDKAEYVQGDKVNVAAQATYFFGGPVADAEVSYSVLSADRFFDYQGKGWWDFTDYDTSRRGEYYGSYGEVIAEGTGVTDSEGRFTFRAEADIAEYTSSQLFTLEATVTDINDQQVSSRTEALVHKGLYYIGLRPERYVGQAGKENSVNVITVDWDSQPAPNRELTVVLAEHNWYSVRKQADDGQYYWESTVEDVPVYTATVETDGDGEASVSFVPETGGTYKVMASGLDEKEHKIRSSAYMWISGYRFINWRQENDDRIDLVADQRQYQVGDTATILIPHPYQGPVKALITLERGHIYQHWVQTLETNSEQIEIPITEDMIPNVFVSVVIVKGQDKSSDLPSFKLGYAQLPIDTAEKELTVTLTPDKPQEEHYQPGETVTYDVLVVDSQGEPVEAELTLSLVDLAVLSLTDQPVDMVSTFWRERGLGVRTASALTLSVDRINVAMAPEAKGGGGGIGEDFGVVRTRFEDTAYWNPTVRTDSQGRASVKVTLPDNLTTWRMSSWGITVDTRVGQSKTDVISTKDLLVRPVAPRFFVIGDRAELAAVVNNNTNQPVDVEVVLEVEGLEMDSPATKRVTIAAHDKARVSWPVNVGKVSEVTLRYGAKTDDLADAMEMSLPVYSYSTPEVVATAGQLDRDGQRVEAVILPASYDPTQGELTVQLDASLAAGMTDGLKYLEHFPYECTEQTVSRFLPNVVTYRAFKELGLDLPELEAALPGLVGVGLQRLYNQQHYDGGWGWWILDRSDPFLTAYVLLGMAEADQAGFVVDDGVMAEAADFLEDSLQAPKTVTQSWQANRQAFILYVLAQAGEGDLGRTVALFGRRQKLDTFGKAYLAMALGLLEPDESSRVDTLLSDITSAAIVSATGAHWEEAQVDYYAMNTDTRSTAIVLAALSRLDPENGLAPNTVRWLMSVREEGRWETTQENAWAIIAFTDWMLATGELEGAYNWGVAVNDATLGTGSVSSSNIKETTKLQVEIARLLADEINRVEIQRSPPDDQAAGSGRLYYSMYLRYFKPVEEVAALNRGIIVSRQYQLADCDEETETCRAIDEAQVGDIIQVKLTIIAPNDLHHVVVEDPFPAGAEGVDQSLKTTSVVGEAPEIKRTDRRNPWGGSYGWWWFSHTEMRDEKAVLFATYLPRGTYEYTYLIRASLAGEYRLIPTHAYEMYFPEVFGRGDGGVFEIEE